jgi:hypothetical protein
MPTRRLVLTRSAAVVGAASTGLLLMNSTPQSAEKQSRGSSASRYNWRNF